MRLVINFRKQETNIPLTYIFIYKVQTKLVQRITPLLQITLEFRKKAFLAKLEYKDTVERNLFVGNAKDAWKGLNTMMGRNQQQKPLTSADPSALANDLNRFYARFDTQDFSDECNTLCESYFLSCHCRLRGCY